MKDKSNITNPDTFLQRSYLIHLFWNKFLTNKTFITGFNDGFHYGRIIQFLSFIDFTATRRTASMDMREIFMILTDILNNVAFHNLHVIYIIKQSEIWRTKATA